MVVSKIHSGLWAQGSLLEVLRGPNEVLRNQPELGVCKAVVLPAALPLYPTFIFQLCFLYISWAGFLTIVFPRAPRCAFKESPPPILGHYLKSKVLGLDKKAHFSEEKILLICWWFKSVCPDPDLQWHNLKEKSRTWRLSSNAVGRTSALHTADLGSIPEFHMVLRTPQD